MIYVLAFVLLVTVYSAVGIIWSRLGKRCPE